MKLCIDCQHCLIPHDTKAAFSKCLCSPTQELINLTPVIGLDLAKDQATLAYSYCSTERSHGVCGLEARNFVAKTN